MKKKAGAKSKTPSKSTPPKKRSTHHGSRTESKGVGDGKPTKTRAARSLGEQERHYWTYDDLAEFTGKTRMAIHQAAHRGSFDPDDLSTVIVYAVRHAKDEMRIKIISAFYPLPTGPGTAKKKEK